MNTYPLGYYVYAYMRKDGTPYYIGKGSGARAWTKGSNEVGKPTDMSKIIVVESNLSSIGAFALERRLIRWYGRIDQNTGILRNQTNGGDGGNGARPGNILSEETKAKISIAHKGKTRQPMSEQSKKKLSESMKGKNLGRKMSQEEKTKRSTALKGRQGRPVSEETKQKLRACNLGKTIGPMSQKQKDKISDALKGRQRSREHCKNLSTAIKGRIASDRERAAYLKSMEFGKTICEHCKKTFSKGNYVRWHGENCKNSPAKSPLANDALVNSVS
jgi:hypothetical protein